MTWHNCTSVCVVNFNSFARVKEVNVIWPCSLGSNGVLGNGQQTVEVVAKPALDNRHKGVEHSSSTAHVSFHACTQAI
jgi:hypothetical protein